MHHNYSFINTRAIGITQPKLAYDIAQVFGMKLEEVFNLDN